MLANFFNIEIKRVNNAFENKVFKSHSHWDYSPYDTYWIGGRFQVSNFSNGYHGILKQWWDYYNKGVSCLLISENNKVKSEFQIQYPEWRFQTLDFYDNKGEPVDIKVNLCDALPSKIDSAFDLIICQATLEHLYDPFMAMKNMSSLLNDKGVVVIHTHVPGYYYHPYPRDYLRFHPDWFEDIPVFIKEYKLLELYATQGHIFSAYEKNIQYSIR